MAEPVTKTDPASKKRKRVVCELPEPYQVQAAGSQSPEGHSEASDDEYDDTFDDENQDLNDASGATTPLITQSAKDEANWPSRQKTIPCPFAGCDKKFNRQAKLQDHLRSHTNERPFKCPKLGCGKDFMRKTHLDRHAKSAHSDKRDYVCSVEGCGKAFSTGTRLRRHETLHVKREEHKCEECGQEFRKHATLQRHVQTEHKGQKAFICDRLLKNGSACGAGFDKHNILASHQARVHNENRYWCDLCTQIADQDSAAGSRASEGEPGQGLGFPTYAAYQIHLREVHPPACSLCGHVCGNKKQVTRHKELEHGIIPEDTTPKAFFPCPDPGCTREFSRKGNLDVHFRSVHTNQRPFVCGEADLSTLNHIEGWDGLDPCGKDFKAKSQLEEHIRTTHLGLMNRAQVRKLKRSKGNANIATNQETDQDVITFLTGITPNAASGGEIACPIVGCQFQGADSHDCDVHLQLVHGLENEDLDFNIFDEPDSVSLEESNIAPNKSPDSEDMLDLGVELEQGAREGRAFWLGSGPTPSARVGADCEDDKDPFAATREEMDRLIGTGHGWEDDVIMDPALLDA